MQVQVEACLKLLYVKDTEMKSRPLCEGESRYSADSNYNFVKKILNTRKATQSKGPGFKISVLLPATLTIDPLHTDRCDRMGICRDICLIGLFKVCRWFLLERL